MEQSRRLNQGPFGALFFWMGWPDPRRLIRLLRPKVNALGVTQAGPKESLADHRPRLTSRMYPKATRAAAFAAHGATYLTPFSLYRARK